MQLSEDFFAMLHFLKTDLTREQIKKELIIARMAGFADLEEYVDLVVRTRAELSAMVRNDQNSVILKYMDWR